jgi:hypothetical protein
MSKKKADAGAIIAKMDAALHEVMDENDRLRTERDELRAEIDTLVNWIQCDQDALMALQLIYRDPKMHQADRIKAAASAIGYERAKPASVVVQVDFRERVRAARLRQLELDRAEWAKLEPPPGATILGQGPEAQAEAGPTEPAA